MKLTDIVRQIVGKEITKLSEAQFKGIEKVPDNVSLEKLKKAFGGTVRESLMLDKNTKAEIEKSIDMGFNKLQVGMISPKRKGVMLMNKNYEVRGVYPIEYQKVIQSIIDDKKK